VIDVQRQLTVEELKEIEEDSKQLLAALLREIMVSPRNLLLFTRLAARYGHAKAIEMLFDSIKELMKAYRGLKE